MCIRDRLAVHRQRVEALDQQEHRRDGEGGKDRQRRRQDLLPPMPLESPLEPDAHGHHGFASWSTPAMASPIDSTGNWSVGPCRAMRPRYSTAIRSDRLRTSSRSSLKISTAAVSYTHLRAHETVL